MTHTFDPNLPTLKDKIRQRVGDTNGLPMWFIADETYLSYARDYTYDEAAAQAAETIGAICAQLATQVQQRNLRINYQERSTAMYTLADRIRNLAAPDPSSPANPGAVSGQMASPILSGYTLGLPVTDPNENAVFVPPTMSDGF